MVPENIHTHPKDGHWKIRGGGGLKSQLKLFKGKYEAKLEIPGGGGVGRNEQKNHPWGSYGYLLKPHILRNIYS